MTQDKYDFDTRPIRPDHDSAIDRSAIVYTQHNDPASKFIERAICVAIALLIVAAIIVHLVR